MEKGAKEAEAWDEVDLSMKTISRLADTERRRVVDAQRTITPEELRMILRGLEEAVTNNVRDQETRTAISRDMQRALDTL